MQHIFTRARTFSKPRTHLLLGGRFGAKVKFVVDDAQLTVLASVQAGELAHHDVEPAFRRSQAGRIATTELGVHCLYVVEYKVLLRGVCILIIRAGSMFRKGELINGGSLYKETDPAAEWEQPGR